MSFVKYVVSVLFFYSFISILKATSYYLTTERPVVQMVNPKFVSYLNVTARRYGRRNPMYYVDIHTNTLVPSDNNALFEIYFFEYGYNQYRRSLLEFHIKWCNLFLNDHFFATALRNTLPLKCPHPAGPYHLYNLTLNADALPDAFPFTKGRLQVNVSYRGEPAVSVYSDLELKKY